MRVSAHKARRWAARLAALSLLSAPACVSVPQQAPFTAAEFAVAEFNTATGKVPFPITLTCTSVNPANGACLASGTFDPTRGRVALPIKPCQTGETPCLSAGNPAGCVSCDSAAGAALKAGLNTLDGFSTYGEMRTTFNKAVNAASVTKQTAFLLDSTTGQIADFRPIILTVDGAPTLLFEPEIPEPAAFTTAKRPLKAETTYFAIVTSKVQDAAGKAIEADRTFTFIRARTPLANADGTPLQNSLLGNAKPADLGCGGSAAEQTACANATRATLERLRQGFDQIFTALEAAPTPLPREAIAILWPVRTQSVAKTMIGLRAALAAVAPTFTAPAQLALPGAAVYNSTTLPPGVQRAVETVQLGCIRMPMMIDPTTRAFSPTVAFRPHYTPYVLTTPVTARPATGYPIAVFGHGITRWRYDMIAIANTLAQAGIATVAIDHVWHGDRTWHKLGVENDNPALCVPSLPGANPAVRCVDATTGDFTTGTPISATACKKCSDAAGVFNPTTMACSVGTPVDDVAVPVPSGANFFPATSPFSTRDNGRQAALDLMQVVRAVKTATTSTGGPAFDATKIHYVGQSLGGIIGTMFAAAEPDIKVAVLNVAGGGIANLIENTDTLAFCKPTFDRLAAGGICQRLVGSGPTPASCTTDTECNVPPVDGGAPVVGPGTENICQASKCVQACGCEVTGAYLQSIASLQWVFDAGDPVNFGRHLIDSPLYCQGPSGPVPCAAAPGATPIKKRILFQRMTGDTVVPNVTTNALRAATGPSACYREFTGGTHGFLLSAAGPNATLIGDAQRQVLSFFASGGATTKLPAFGGGASDACPMP